MTMKLRDYQSEDRKSILSNFKEKGMSEQMIVQATGLGKTVLGTNLLKDAKRGLWLTHREELISQSAMSCIISEFGTDAINHIKPYKTYLNYIRHSSSMDSIMYEKYRNRVGIVKEKLLDKDSKIVVASIQTIVRRLQHFDPDQFEYIICDEAHLAMSAGWLKVINYFNPELLLGLTATPHRLDGLPLHTVFKDITVNRDIKWGIDNGYLVEIDAIRVKTEISLDEVSRRGGEFATRQLEQTINIPQRNKLICDKWKKYAFGKQTLFFATDVQHALDMNAMCEKEGILSTFVVGDKQLCPNRGERISQFKNGDVQWLINVDIATTGFDHDMIECIILGRPTMSLTLFLQMVGRGTRTEKGIIAGLDTAEERINAISSSNKTKLTLMDIVDNTNRHRLINTWTLEKDKDPKDMVFITKDTRKKLEIAKEKRIRKLHHKQKEDQKVKLLAVPDITIHNVGKMREPATENQLRLLTKEGYDVSNNSYTKYGASLIISNMTLHPWQIRDLRNLGYNADVNTTFGQYGAIKKKIKSDFDKQKEENLRNKLKSLPFTDIL